MYYAPPGRDRAVSDIAPWQGGEHNENDAGRGPMLPLLDVAGETNS